MSLNNRTLKYSLAINEAFHQMMHMDPNVFLIGQGVKSPWYVGNTAKGLLDRFGSDRIIDTPVSENAITGAAIGAAIAGMRPVVVHPRMDFMLYAMSPIINEAANWHYMFGGNACVPVVIWGIINRGGEQAAQHSQAIHAMFAHIPGLKVVMPATPYDAKGLLISSIKDDNPVVYIEDRWLHHMEGNVPEHVYEVPIGKASIVKEGTDISILALSYMVPMAIEASEKLQAEGIDVEVVDLRTIKPLDKETITASVKKTGRAVIADTGWKSFGVSGEISAILYEEVLNKLKAPVVRIALPDVPAPASASLEKIYYPTADMIVKSVVKCISEKRS
ncbi:MAG: pyruvate dehydrogenase complex E1 component subunit beta [Pseudomonadota bacterium]